MRRNIFAICDPEEEYACNMMEYLTGRSNIPFEIRAFTSVETLLSCASEQRIELLLISASVLTREIRELDIGRIVLLSESSFPTEGEDLDSVYKYQSCAQVLRETMAAYSESRMRIADVFPALKKTTCIYGIYSPLNRCGKTSFALALGQELARKKPTFFLSLEGCAGLEKLLSRTFTHNLSDLLYYARQKDPALIHRLNGMIQTIDHLDFVPPVRFAEDIRQSSWADLEYLLGELLARSAYEAVVLDVGSEIPELLALLDLCTKIYMPVLTDPVSEAKLEQYEAMLRTMNCGKILSKTSKLMLPRQAGTDPQEDYVSQLLWNGYGQAARDILSGGQTQEQA